MRLISIWLFSFLTGVCLISFSPLALVAADNDGKRENNTDSMDATAYKDCIKGDPKNYKKCMTEINEEKLKHAQALAKITYDEDKKNCKAAAEEMADARAKFLGSCGGSKAASQSRRSDWSGASVDSCLNVYSQCSECRSGTKSVSNGIYCETDEETRQDKIQSFSEMISGKMSQAQNNNSYQKKTFDESISPGFLKSCPPVAADLIESLADKIKERKEESRDLEDDLTTTQKELADTQNEFQDIQSVYLRDSQSLQKNSQKAMDALATKAKEDIKKSRAEYDDLNAKISELTLGFEELNLNRADKIAEIEDDCYNKAIVALNDHLKIRNDKLNSSTLTAGTFLDLMNQTGQKKRRQKNSDYANIQYQSCMSDSFHKNKRQSIDNHYKIGVEKINSLIQSARDRQKKLVLDMGGPDTQSEFNKALGEVKSEYDSKYQDLTGKYTVDANKKANEINDLNQKIQTLTNRMRESNADWNQLVAAHTAAKDSGTGISKDAAGDFFNNAAAFTSKVSRVISACECASKDNKEMDPVCKTAQTYACYKSFQHENKSGVDCDPSAGSTKKSDGSSDSEASK